MRWAVAGSVTSHCSCACATYDGLAAAVLEVVGEAGYRDFVRRLVAMIIVGNTDAHLKNWAFRYPAGRRVELAPVYDFHSLTVYDRFRYAPLALSLNGEVMTAHLSPDDFRWLAVGRPHRSRCGDHGPGRRVRRA